MSPRALDYPVALKLLGKRVLLVGGGPIAEGRARQLVEVGAHVHLVAPEATDALRQLAAEGRLRWSQRRYAPGDCQGNTLVFTATDDAAVSHAAVAEARGLGVLANAADVPELCDFNVPSIERRGPVTIAVSTAGNAPGLSRAIRRKLAATVGPEYGTLARLLGRLRRLSPAGRPRARALQAIIDGGAAELIERGERHVLWRLIRRELAAPAPSPSPETTQVAGGVS